MHETVLNCLLTPIGQLASPFKVFHNLRSLDPSAISSQSKTTPEMRCFFFEKPVWINAELGSPYLLPKSNCENRLLPSAALQLKSVSVTAKKLKEEFQSDNGIDSYFRPIFL